MPVRAKPVFTRIRPYGLDWLRSVRLKRANQRIGRIPLMDYLERYDFLAREWIETRVMLV